MNKPQVHPLGYWLSGEEGHFSQEQGYFFDSALSDELALMLAGKSICDFGCGLGKYVHSLRERGFECDGYDGNPNTEDLTQGVCGTLNLAEPIRLEKQYDGVICFEVGEHIPKQHESVFLDNLTSHAKEMVVLSWAIPGQDGDGHVNCRSNSYIIFQLWRRGFRFEPVASALLRANCSLDWFKNTLMVFSRRRALYSRAEIRATRKMVGADVERLKKNNRSNSSLGDALVGKIVRTFSRADERLSRLSNRLRLRRYDANLVVAVRGLDVAGERRGGAVRFFPVCFTCAKHFRFARLALLSLGRCGPPIAKIHIYIDKGDPFSQAQREQLRAESRFPIVFESTRYPMASWGPKVQLSELQAYREVAEQMSADDYLVKFDSDVLFLSDGIFRLVAHSKASAVGTPVSKLHDSEQQEDYMQGGCYFIGARELRAILAIPVTQTSTAPTKWGEIPEDQFFSALLRRCGVQPVYNDFLYFDPIFIATGTEKDDLEVRLKAMPETADVLHFEGNKLDKVDRSNMKVVAEHFFGPLPPILNPYQDQGLK